MGPYLYQQILLVLSSEDVVQEDTSKCHESTKELSMSFQRTRKGKPNQNINIFFVEVVASFPGLVGPGNEARRVVDSGTIVPVSDEVTQEPLPSAKSARLESQSSEMGDDGVGSREGAEGRRKKRNRQHKKKDWSVLLNKLSLRVISK